MITETGVFTNDIDFLWHEIMYNIAVPRVTDRTTGETYYIPMITVNGALMNYDKEHRPPFVNEDDAFAWAFKWVKTTYK